MSKFRPIDAFKNRDASYSLLPFRFERLNSADYILTNMVGEYLLIQRDVLHAFVHHRLSEENPSYIDLRSKHFLEDEKTIASAELLCIKLNTKLSILSQFTGLHIFVVSLRCEHSCPYCQVSRQSDDKLRFDMPRHVADKAIDLALMSPSKSIKIEFQGGEPLLNFELIKYIVIEAKKRGKHKNISFVIATNLALLTDEVLDFCKQHKIKISTSLDGPRDLHNKNRPRPGKDSYERAVKGIKAAQLHLGLENVSALMTTTSNSFGKVKEIIDEYRQIGFSGIFLRPLSPYGFAVKTKKYNEYDTALWQNFYEEGIDYIIQLNRTGIDFREYYAGTILAKMLTCQEPGYVDLMSPAGIGIGAVVYNYDGKVYASDEGRMLAEMGDSAFELGNVLTDTYGEIFLNPKLLDALEDSFAYSVPGCNECAFENYCGADPVFHHSQFGDYVGRKPASSFCKRNKRIFKYLIARMEKDKQVKRIFTRWAQPHD